jgi:hypothetical protein
LQLRVLIVPMRSRGAFGPEAIAEMGEILNAAFEKLQGSSEPNVVREGIAMRIIAAARFGERDPARLLEAALRRPASLSETQTPTY